MEEVDLLLNPKNSNWKETDNFAKETKQNTNSGKGIIKESVELIKDEAKTIAPEIVEVFEDSKDRLNLKKRPIKQVSNPLFFYAISSALLVSSIFVLKKLF